MTIERATWIEIAVGTVAFLVGCVYGALVNFSYQIKVYEILRNTSAIIFGVTGAWYAVITPIYLSSNGGGDKVKYARRLLKNLITPIKYSVYILCITIIFQLAYPAALMLNLNELVKVVLKAISFGVMSSLSVLMLFTLVRSLVPNDFVQTDIEINEELQWYQERMRSQTKEEGD